MSVYNTKLFRVLRGQHGELGELCEDALSDGSLVPVAVAKHPPQPRVSNQAHT